MGTKGFQSLFGLVLASGFCAVLGAVVLVTSEPPTATSARPMVVAKLEPRPTPQNTQTALPVEYEPVAQTSKPAEKMDPAYSDVPGEADYAREPASAEWQGEVPENMDYQEPIEEESDFSSVSSSSAYEE